MKNQTKEFNLSDKIQEECLGYDRLDCIALRDVKEFIKRLKKSIDKVNVWTCSKADMKEVIDKLAGDKLKSQFKHLSPHEPITSGEKGLNETSIEADSRKGDKR